jgi:guanine deaminase
MPEYTIYYGTLIHSISIEQLDIVSNGVLVVDDKGVIVHVEKDVENLQEFLDTQSFKDAEVKYTQYAQ